MTTATLDPVGVTLGTGLADVYGPVPAGFVDILDARICNIGSADAVVDLFLVNTADPTADMYRWKNEPVPFGVMGTGFDLERSRELTAGWKIQGKASVAATLCLSFANGRRRGAAAGGGSDGQISFDWSDPGSALDLSL